MCVCVCVCVYVCVHASVNACKQQQKSPIHNHILSQKSKAKYSELDCVLTVIMFVSEGSSLAR